MKYFRVPEKLDNLNIYHDGKYKGFLIRNELFTEREIDRLFPWVKNKLEEVEIKKSKTHWFFGARFESES